MSVSGMTTRRWMIVIALVAVLFGYFAASIRMWRLANYHGAESRRVAHARTSGHRAYVLSRWHHEMEERYRSAMWFPWLAFEPAPNPP
jgi:hypothetical protein